MDPFLCSPPDPDGKISPLRPRIEGLDCMYEGGVFNLPWGADHLMFMEDNLEIY
jgi:hypothetical protein